MRTDSIWPGITALARTPAGAYSTARLRVSARSPPLAAEYGNEARPLRCPWADAMVTMLPPACRSSGYASRAQCQAERRFRSRHAAQSASVAVRVVCWYGRPAFATSTSSRPNRSAVAANSARTAVASVTSVGTATAPAPSACAVSPSASASTSASTTRAPSATKRRATAAPMPRAAPVTTAVRSRSRIGG